MKKLIGLIMLFMFAAVMSYAAESTAATGDARAKIVEAVTLTHASEEALDFGVIVKPAAAATVQVNPSASATATTLTGSVQHVTSEEHVTADRFTISGLGNAQYQVNLPNEAITLTGSESGSMTVDTFATNATGSTNTATEFYVGGVLHIGSNQDAGTYTGHYTVTITY